MVKTYIRNKEGKFYSFNDKFLDFEHANDFLNEDVAEKYKKMLVKLYKLENQELHVVTFEGSMQ